MKTVYILGTDGVRNWPKNLTEDQKVWTCNGLHVVMPEYAKPDAWFQIHRPEDLSKESPEHLAWLAQPHDFPVYMHEHVDAIPASVRLPMEELVSLWPASFMTPSFSCTFSWMVAMAIREHFEIIAMQGINMWSPREAWLEVPNLMFWLGAASQRGIQLDIAGRLFQPQLYGYEPRRVPLWLPEDVANDLIVDSWEGSRKQKHEWLFRRNHGFDYTDSVSFEDVK